MSRFCDVTNAAERVSLYTIAALTLRAHTRVAAVVRTS